MTKCKQHKWRRAALALPVVAVSLAFTGAASAQTFQASVKAVNVSGVAKTRPSCAPTVPADITVLHLFCGTASIAGYGSADWTLNTTGLSSTTGSACLEYTAITTFKLHSDGSTLVLDEGYVDPNTGEQLLTDAAQGCSPGNSGSAASQDSFFAPLFSPEPNTWTACLPSSPACPPDQPASTGVFTGVTGSGTDTLQSTGPQTSGTYTGTLTPGASS